MRDFGFENETIRRDKFPLKRETEKKSDVPEERSTTQSVLGECIGGRITHFFWRWTFTRPHLKCGIKYRDK